MQILIVKFGALGDVVRTSYFAKAIKEKFNCQIWWLTSTNSFQIIRFNPYIDNIIFDVKCINKLEFDIVYSLDDELNILRQVSMLSYKKIVGAYLPYDDSLFPEYSENSSDWYDMGLISKYGKDEANKKKKNNTKSHAEIFKKIFDVENVSPKFYNSKVVEKSIEDEINKNFSNAFLVGINPFSGKRWPSKAINYNTLITLINSLVNCKINNKKVFVFLLGGIEEFEKNFKIYEFFEKNSQIIVPNSGHNILDFAAIIKNMDLLITSDSLALHFAIANGVPSVSIFTATSAVEIDTFGTGVKIISSSSDYCSYKPDADNSTITPENILFQIEKNLKLHIINLSNTRNGNSFELRENN